MTMSQNTNKPDLILPAEIAERMRESIGFVFRHLYSLHGVRYECNEDIGTLAVLDLSMAMDRLNAVMLPLCGDTCVPLDPIPAVTVIPAEVAESLARMALSAGADTDSDQSDSRNA